MNKPITRKQFIEALEVVKIYTDKLMHEQYIAGMVDRYDANRIESIMSIVRKLIETYDLASNSREWEKLDIRQCLMHWLRMNTFLSLREIGEIFNKKNHATVIHSVNRVNQLMEIGDEKILANMKIVTDNLDRYCMKKKCKK